MASVAASLAPAEVLGHEQSLRAAHGGRGTALRLALSFLLLSTTVLQSLGINFGTYSLNTALLGMYGCLLVAGLSGALALSHRRLVLYVTGVTVALTSLLVNASFARQDDSSGSSFLLLAVIYLPFVFVVRGGSGSDNRWVIRHFLDIALFCALAGILQFGAQFVTGADWLFNFSAYLPPLLQGPAGFNTVIPVGSLFKSNGFFFREPSGFSFIMALALVCEHVLYKRVGRALCFGLALLLTYSGTGLLALLIAVAFPLGRKTLMRLGVLAAVGGATLWLLGDALNLSFTLGRIQEFGSERSSAYIRYIAPFRLIADTFGAEVWTLWLGHGPGTVFRQTLPYEFHDPTWAKLIVEYGVIGCIVFVALLLTTLFPTLLSGRTLSPAMRRRNALPLPIRATLFFYWLIMGGHLLSPEVSFMTLALVGLLPPAVPPSMPATPHDD
jgi:hypothetical protein